jgi:hypothetical protein
MYAFFLGRKLVSKRLLVYKFVALVLIESLLSISWYTYLVRILEECTMWLELKKLSPAAFSVSFLGILKPRCPPNGRAITAGIE